MISKPIKLATLGLAFTLAFSCSSDKEDPPIPNKIPDSYDFEVNGTGKVYFDNQAKTVTVAARQDKSPGKITVYYEGKEEDQYPKVDVPPVDFGEYMVTFDVEAAPGWDSATIYAGTLVIADGTPDVPSGVSAAIQSPTSIKISWSSVERATSYKVFYITEGMEEIEFAEEVSSGTSFTHTGLTEGNTYYYFITAVNSYGESSYSDFKVIKISAPVAPQNLQAQATASDKITVKWGSVAGATSYKVYYSTNPNTDKALLGTYTSNSVNVTTGLAAGTTFYFYVAAVNAVGESDLSEPVSAKTFSISTNPDLALAVVKQLPEIPTSNWIRIYVTKYRMRTDQDLIILYTTDSPDNRKKFFDYLPYDILRSWNHVEFTKPLPNTTYYFWATLDHYADNYDFDNNGYERCGSLFEPEPDCVSPYGYSEVVSFRTGDPPPPPSATPSPALPSSPPTGASAGQKMCTNCSGSGKCHRALDIAFGICEGGYVKCNTCNGTGTYKNKTCTSCKGAKKTKCGLCNGTGKCNRCNGTGKI